MIQRFPTLNSNDSFRINCGIGGEVSTYPLRKRGPVRLRDRRFSSLLQASWASTPVRFRTLLMDESLRDVAADNSASAFCVPSLVRMHGRHTRLMEATIRYRHLRPARRSRASASSLSSEKPIAMPPASHRFLHLARAAEELVASD
jgi:hypothetical protein